MLGDGLLNGAGGFNGMEFIEPADLQDLDKDGIATDPGWIKLASVERDPLYIPASLGESVSYAESGAGVAPFTLDIGDLLTLEMECDGRFRCTKGSWRLSTQLTIIDEVQALLGEATFDHLAFSINTIGRFAVYDFNFKDIFAEENNPALNFNTPYVLGGEFNTDDFPLWRAQESALYISVWARDPADLSVPEPASLLLISLALLGVSLRRGY